jgi:hypothetical protein
VAQVGIAVSEPPRWFSLGRWITGHHEHVLDLLVGHDADLVQPLSSDNQNIPTIFEKAARPALAPSKRLLTRSAKCRSRLSSLIEPGGER